jgi:AraC-like DNA-binding protein
VDYQEFLPHPRLRPFVRVCWTLSGSGAEMAPQPVLPDGCTELIIHRAQPFWRHLAGGISERQSRRLFVGQMLSPVVIAPAKEADAEIIAFRFEPFGAHVLIGTPQTDTADQIVDADSLGEPWLSRATAAAEAADSTAEALRFIERALIARLDRRRAAADVRVVSATQALIVSGGRLSIERTARRAGTSPRQLERLFQAQIGTTPKRFARVLRFQGAASEIIGDTDGKPAPLAEISAASGYFDQAHMIRDFVTFAGTTPGQFSAKLGELTKLMLA